MTLLDILFNLALATLLGGVFLTAFGVLEPLVGFIFDALQRPRPQDKPSEPEAERTERLSRELSALYDRFLGPQGEPAPRKSTHRKKHGAPRGHGAKHKRGAR